MVCSSTASAPAGRRHCGDEGLAGEGPVEPHLDDADLLAARLQGRRRLARRLGARAHRHDDPLGVRRTDVIEQTVVPAGQRGEAVHGRLNRRRDARVEGVHRLPRLEERIRVVRGAADERMLGVERPRRGARARDRRIDHRADLVVAEKRKRVDLVRGAESVEEMHEGDTRLERRRLGDQRVVMGLLHRSRGEQREAGGPRRHHVGMVAEDRQRLRRERRAPQRETPSPSARPRS